MRPRNVLLCTGRVTDTGVTVSAVSAPGPSNCAPNGRKNEKFALSLTKRSHGCSTKGKAHKRYKGSRRHNYFLSKKRGCFALFMSDTRHPFCPGGGSAPIRRSRKSSGRRENPLSEGHPKGILFTLVGRSAGLSSDGIRENQSRIWRRRMSPHARETKTAIAAVFESPRVMADSELLLPI